MNAKLGHRLNSIGAISTSPNSVSYLNTLKLSRAMTKSEEEKIYAKEIFVPPEISMINYFLNIVSDFIF